MLLWAMMLVPVWVPRAMTVWPQWVLAPVLPCVITLVPLEVMTSVLSWESAGCAMGDDVGAIMSVNVGAAVGYDVGAAVAADV